MENLLLRPVEPGVRFLADESIPYFGENFVDQGGAQLTPDRGELPLHRLLIGGPLLEQREKLLLAGAEQLAELFELGFSQKRERIGMGLGLVTGQRVVQRHGGTLDVQSVLSKGTTFAMRLPLQSPLQRAT